MPQASSKSARDNTRYVLQFMVEVIRRNRETGAIGPSGRELARVVSSMARLDEARVIVEFGPGTGVFTEEIERVRRRDASFLAVEVNPEFVKATRRRCPSVSVIEGSAAETPRYLREHGFEHCDTIISGLPWTRFPDRLQDEILHAAYESLRPGGLFITFAYSISPLVPSGRKFFRGKLLRKFPHLERTRHIWKNFPPCVVYIGRKPMEADSTAEPRSTA